jgi:hypothetical protein
MGVSQWRESALVSIDTAPQLCCNFELAEAVRAHPSGMMALKATDDVHNASSVLIHRDVKNMSAALALAESRQAVKVHSADLVTGLCYGMAGRQT